jgi:hypothetical protein
MPSVEDPRYLGISIRSGLPNQLHLGSNIEGGSVSSFFKGVGRTFKKAGKALKPFASTALDVAVPLGIEAVAPELTPFVPAISGVARGGIKNLTGVGLVMGGQRGMRKM